MLEVAQQEQQLADEKINAIKSKRDECQNAI